MIFLFEAVPESIVHRYFLQVLVGWIYRFPGSRMPVGNTDALGGERTLIQVEAAAAAAVRSAVAADN